MTLITMQDGTVVFRDGKAGTGQECCCEQDDECDLSSADSDSQPNVTVSTDCQCNAGTLDGNYPYIGTDFDSNLAWTGTTTCDFTGLPSDAPMTISVSSSCVVTVATYQYPFQSLQGSALAALLEVDLNGNIVGTAQVPLFDLFDNLQCTATVTFGP
jgi:hypothetical protein